MDIIEPGSVSIPQDSPQSPTNSRASWLSIVAILASSVSLGILYDTCKDFKEMKSIYTVGAYYQMNRPASIATNEAGLVITNAESNASAYILSNRYGRFIIEAKLPEGVAITSPNIK